MFRILNFWFVNAESGLLDPRIWRQFVSSNPGDVSVTTRKTWILRCCIILRFRRNTQTSVWTKCRDPGCQRNHSALKSYLSGTECGSSVPLTQKSSLGLQLSTTCTVHVLPLTLDNLAGACSTEAKLHSSSKSMDSFLCLCSDNVNSSAYTMPSNIIS
jgi:hypothetical protein